jgi:predicted ester cyclase
MSWSTPRGVFNDGRRTREAGVARRREVQEAVAQGNVEVARVIVTGTLVHDFAGISGGGRSFRMDQAVMCHLDGGKIAEAWELADVGSLVDQRP